jgi:type VII secretion-associated serine protease mycosin
MRSSSFTGKKNSFRTQIKGLAAVLLAALALSSTGLPGWVEAASGPTRQIFLPLAFNSSSAPGGSTGGTTCIPAQSVQDPLFASSQANMRQIHASDAWAACIQGSPQVVVAVVDGGVDLTHPDLAANLEQGYNFVENNTTPADDNGHGTHVAGIIAASLNGQGVVGVAPQVKILPVRVMGNGSGDDSTVAKGIRWAADRAQIINLSLGGPSVSSVLRDAINYAIQTKGRVVVAAAGNYGASGNQTQYPAALPGVVAVGAVDANGNHASFSNTGSYVQLSAPGVSILSTFLSGQYARLSGTSMAAPHVSGLAGLIWAQHPEYSAAQVIAAMESTASDLGSAGRDSTYGYGLIDAYPAASLAAAPQVTAASETQAPAPAEDRSAPIAAGRVLVKLKAGVDPSALASAAPNIRLAGEIDGMKVEIFQVPDGGEWAAIDVLRKLVGVDYAEPDYVVNVIQ